jgi:hypothetical protein|tara:strand:+ start:435 stop:815 length:381 start_codon:yes stop_codon:yes gene_type:complete
VARLADKIRQADDREVETIDVEGWGVKIGVRSMTALQRSQMQEEWATDEDNTATKLYSMVLLHCCFDPDSGEQVFTEEDLEWLLAEKSAQTVDEVAQACLRISGLASDSVDEVGKDSSDSVEETLS